MRAIIQRVAGSCVMVGGEVVGACDAQGLTILVGIATDDTPADAEYVCRKILNLRLFDNPENGKSWAKNVMDINGGILMISQFTLCHVLKGNKPDFHNAMKGEQAKEMFDSMVASMKKTYKEDKIQTGQFGADMQVQINNDGPVTVTLDSRDSVQRTPLTPASPLKSPTEKKE